MTILSVHSNKDIYQLFMRINEDKLQALLPFNNTCLDDDIWKFKYKKSSYSADFSCFHLQYTHFTMDISLTFHSERISITNTQLAKILLLSLMEGTTSRQTTGRAVECIALLFNYLKIKGVNCLVVDDLIGLYTQLLTINPTSHGLVPRFVVPAFGSRFSIFDVKRLLSTIKANNFDVLLLPKVPMKYYVEAQNTACKKEVGITLSDYKKGGSFDFLGLDIGRHYVDFCAETFERHSVYATSCRMTLSSIVSDVMKEIDYKTSRMIKRICSETLMGMALDDIGVEPSSKIAKSTLFIIYRRTLTLFSSIFTRLAQKTNAFKLINVNEIVKMLKLPEERFDNQEFVRAMLFSRFHGENGKLREHIILEFKASLASRDVDFNWGISEFDAIVDNLCKVKSLNNRNASLLCRKHYDECEKLREIDLEKERVGVKKLKIVLNNIESAGTTVFVSMTGWRASEFGFPLNSINISVNQEIIDGNYTPYRFHVSWVVPKTSANTPLDREITLACYVLASQLELLNQENPKYPCLYSCIDSSESVFESKNYIENRMAKIWSGFCEYYIMFTDLDEQELLKKKKLLTSKEENRLIELNLRYDIQSSQTESLYQMRDKLRVDLVRFNFVKATNGRSFKKQLQHYQNRTLSAEYSALFEKYLSNETLQAIKIGIVILDLETVRSISAEFLEGSVHPTAHAMRHIWAEAVLRRYRGDVGKFIRVNFKHLTDKFFMAYLRDKETSIMYEVAQRNVINSVVRDHLLAQQYGKRDYAGGFDSYLSKVVNVTKIISNEEYNHMAKTISEDRIVAIKSNAWATCLLRVGTSLNAKCSVDGVPQRRNASPKFCLSCINANVSEGNFNCIVVYTRPEVEACRNPELPAFVKAHCIEVLKPALAQVKILRKNSGNSKYDKFIAHLEESIKMANQTISEST
jgi:hypothetical protein